MRRAGIPIKLIRHVAIQYHLYHQSKAYDNKDTRMLFQKCIEQAHIRTEKERDQYLLEIDNNSYGINPCLTRFRLSLAQRTELLGNLVVCVKFCHQFL